VSDGRLPIALKPKHPLSLLSVGADVAAELDANVRLPRHPSGRRALAIRSDIRAGCVAALPCPLPAYQASHGACGLGPVGKMRG